MRGGEVKTEKEEKWKMGKGIFPWRFDAEEEKEKWHEKEKGNHYQDAQEIKGTELMISGPALQLFGNEILWTSSVCGVREKNKH